MIKERCACGAEIQIEFPEQHYNEVVITRLWDTYKAHAGCMDAVRSTRALGDPPVHVRMR